ncbi:MAG: hypothetical protein OHK0013_18330 [Sandaracinaceae bacterium]
MSTEDPPRPDPARPARVDGIDVARGLASAIMIQGHAYDGWVDEESKQTAAYLFTRLLGSLPLPSFLLLAGAAIALRVEAAIARREPPRAVRAALARRGLEVLVIGYAVNAVSALMDGWEGPETLFRADVLPLIGLCIATVALAGIGPDADGALDRRRLALTGAALAVVPVVICPWVTPWSRSVEGPARLALGLIAEVPEVTRMPFVPLAGWAGVGVLIGLFLVRANRLARSVAGAPRHVLFALFVVALSVAVGFTHLTHVWVEASGRPLDRAHPAVIANAIELAGRGTLVLCAGAIATPYLPDALRRVLLRLGRGSLVAYVFHVPFCYGSLGAPIRGRLDMVEATVLVVLLEVASFGAVWVRDTFRDRRAGRT